MNLRYCMYAAGFGCHEDRHPQVVMAALGIKYEHATPQSIADQWWFWNCTNVPAELPRYLTVLTVTPRQAIGYGLTAEEAARLDPDASDKSDAS